MPLLKAARPWSAALALLVSSGLFAESGCHRDDGAQLQVVQSLARDLGSARLLRTRAACQHLSAEQREMLLCDGMIQTLMHFAPGFAGSAVTALGPSSGGWRGHPSRLPVHYQGPGGAGNLDALLRREKTEWRIVSLLPRP
jgi:hypothetical protein